MTGINLFIIEDSKPKLAQMKAALPREFRFDILDTHSIAQAERALENRTWDLIILDMTFEVSMGVGNNEKEALAGVEVLQFMNRKNIRTPVIVATQHTNFFSRFGLEIDSIEKLDVKLSKLFPRNYSAIIHVDLESSAWKTPFQSSVRAALTGRARAE